MTKILHSFCFLLLVCSILLFSCGGGGSGSGSSGTGDTVTLVWDAPTTNADGTPLTDLAGYKIYYGQRSGIYTHSIDVKSSTTATIGGLTSGHWCFAVTAYDTSGNESDYSKEVCTDIY